MNQQGNEHRAIYMKICLAPALNVFALERCMIIYLHIYKITTMCDVAHLSVPDHYHPDKDNVDVGSQRLIVVDFINLKGNEHYLSLICGMKETQ